MQSPYHEAEILTISDFNNMRRQKGQTLVEIVAAIGVVLLLLTGLLAGAVASLKAAQLGKTKSLAVHWGQEAMEIVRNKRNNSWSDFFTYAGKTWCLDKAGTWTEMAAICPVNIDSVYTRTVVFTWHPDLNPNNEKMGVDVSVSWQGGKYTVNLSTYFTQWR